MKEQEQVAFYNQVTWCWGLPLLLAACALPNLLEVIRVYRGLEEVLWGSLWWAAAFLLAGVACFLFTWRFRAVAGSKGMAVRRFLQPDLFLDWRRVNEAREGEMGMNRWLALESDAGKVNFGRMEVGKENYDLLRAVVREKLENASGSALDEAGNFLPLERRKVLFRMVLYMIPLIFLVVLVSGRRSASRTAVPDDVDMGLILYCGIRHERDVEKARAYLDNDTLKVAEWVLRHPEMVHPHQGRPWFGRDGREAYLVGCLKAGGFLDQVPGTAEEWLKRGGALSQAILRRIEG